MSTTPYETSHKLSRDVEDFFLGKTDKPVWDKSVILREEIFRKGAHIFLYGSVGAFFSITLMKLRKLSGKKTLLATIILTGVIACSDEVIQSFNGRSSKISDVILDIAASAVFGFLTIKITHYRQRKRGNKNG